MSEESAQIQSRLIRDLEPVVAVELEPAEWGAGGHLAQVFKKIFLKNDNNNKFFILKKKQE